MLESLRNFLTGPRLFLVIAACALPFVFLGSTSLLTPSIGNLGSINGERVTEMDFQVAENIVISRLESIYGDNFDFSILDEELQINQIKNQVIIQKSLLSQARSLGLLNNFTRELAKKQIMTNTNFQVDGMFNEGVYEVQVNTAGHTKESYIDLVTDMLGIELFRRSMLSSFNTKNEIIEVASLLEQTIDIDFIKIDSIALQSNIKNTNNELEEFYSENEFLFYSDEQRKFEYILLKSEDYESKVVIPDNYINDSYEDYLSKADERNQVRISHIMIDKANYDSDVNAFNAIQTIETQLLDGANFSELALEYSDDPVSNQNGGDLEYFTPDLFGEEFDKAIKDLKLNDVSEIVELDSSFHIIKVTEYQEASILSFDEMKESITSGLVDSESLALMQDDYDIAYDLIDNNSSLNLISSSLSVDIIESNMLTKNNIVSENFDYRVRDYIFSPDTEVNVPFAIDLDEGILIVSLTEINESTLRKLESVSLIANDMLSAKKGKEKQAMLSEEIKALKAEDSLMDFIAVYPYVAKDSFINVNRYSSLMPKEIITELFKQSSGDRITLTANNNDTYIVDVIGINQPSDEASIALIDDYKGLVEELTSTKINQIISDEVITNANVNFNNNISFTNE